MNRNQAKEILAVFRPGTPDETDPFFAEAIEMMKTDATLREWFDGQSALDASLRAKLRQLPAPVGLKEAILSGNPLPARMVWFRRPSLWAAAAAFAGLMVLMGWWLANRGQDGSVPDRSTVNSTAREQIDFATYREKMARIVSGNYKMSFRSRDLEKIREFLAKNKGHMDYELTPPLQKLPGEGTAVLHWRGITTSLVCLDVGRKTMLYLFITDRSNLPDAPANTTPEFVQLDKLACASWAQGAKTYLLLTEGDHTSLRTYF
jgi:hypothetical protein